MSDVNVKDIFNYPVYVKSLFICAWLWTPAAVIVVYSTSNDRGLKTSIWHWIKTRGQEFRGWKWGEIWWVATGSCWLHTVHFAWNCLTVEFGFAAVVQFSECCHTERLLF